MSASFYSSGKRKSVSACNGTVCKGTRFNMSHEMWARSIILTTFLKSFCCNVWWDEVESSFLTDTGVVMILMSSDQLYPLWKWWVFKVSNIICWLFRIIPNCENWSFKVRKWLLLKPNTGRFSMGLMQPASALCILLPDLEKKGWGKEGGAGGRG